MLANTFEIPNSSKDPNSPYWHRQAVLYGKRLASLIGEAAYHDYLDENLPSGYTWRDLYGLCLARYEEIKACNQTIGS